MEVNRGWKREAYLEDVFNTCHNNFLNVGNVEKETINLMLCAY